MPGRFCPRVSPKCLGRMCNDYTLPRIGHSGLPPSGGAKRCGADALLVIGETLDLPGPGEFGRPVSLEPHGPDSLPAYDVSLGRIFTLPGDGGRGRQVVAMTRMGARIWAALSLGTPPGLMGLATPPGTKARDTVSILEVTGPSPTVGAGARYELLRAHSRRTCRLGDDSRRRGTAVRGDLRRGFAGGVRLSCGRRCGRIGPVPGRAGGVAAAGFARDDRKPGGVVVDRGSGGRIDGVSCVGGVGGWVGAAGEAWFRRDGPVREP